MRQPLEKSPRRSTGPRPVLENERSIGLRPVLDTFRTGALACAAISITLAAPAQVAQFDASRADRLTLSGSAVLEWRSVKSGISLTPLHGPSNGWASASRLAPYGTKSTVSFAGNGGTVPSPMTFGEGDDTPVSAVFAVVKCTAPAQFSTLMDAPVDVRLAAQPAVPPSFKFSEEQLGHTATYHINGTESAGFAPSASYQLVEVTFGNPPELSEIFVGGSIPSPLWKRNWRGEIAELLFFPSPPTPEERNAARHYASVKWGVAVPYVHDFDIASRLRGLGISTELFSTRIIVR